MGNIKHRSIEEFQEFDRCGYHYQRVGYKGNYYLFSVTREGMNYPSYEIWKGKKYKQPDGSEVYVRPSDEDWGDCGWTICGSGIQKSLEKIKSRDDNFDIDYFKELV